MQACTLSEFLFETVGGARGSPNGIVYNFGMRFLHLRDCPSEAALNTGIDTEVKHLKANVAIIKEREDLGWAAHLEALLTIIT